MCVCVCVCVCACVCVCVCCVWCQVKYAKLRADWTVILELLRQHKERMAALLVAKKASKDLFSSVVNVTSEDLRLG